MLATIHLKQLRFHGRHGVLPEEAVLGQPWILDLDLVVDIAQAAASDDLTQTVNYAEVYELCRDLVTRERFALIETLAHRILSAVLAAHPSVLSATLTIHKPHVPIPGDHAGIALTTTLAR
ncbi:MAG: dihydroneopterin aldolase [Verrucomicrobia bacterium]|nr:dihydroneopterin aldolase [Verrucomicrobiota bacterium]